MPTRTSPVPDFTLSDFGGSAPVTAATLIEPTPVLNSHFFVTITRSMWMSPVPDFTSEPSTSSIFTSPAPVLTSESTNAVPVMLPAPVFTLESTPRAAMSTSPWATDSSICAVSTGIVMTTSPGVPPVPNVFCSRTRTPASLVSIRAPAGWFSHSTDGSAPGSTTMRTPALYSFTRILKFIVSPYIDQPLSRFALGWRRDSLSVTASTIQEFREPPVVCVWVVMASRSVRGRRSVMRTTGFRRR